MLSNSNLITFRFELPFKKRIWMSFKKPILLLIFPCIIIGLISGIKILFLCIFYVILLLLIILIKSYINNKYFLCSIEIDSDARNLSYTILKFDKIYKRMEIEIDEIDVSIKEKLGVYKTFHLRIKHLGFHFNQNASGGWSEEEFVSIVKKVNEIKGLPSYLNFVSS
jgi:hypothetical protein